MFLVNFTIDAAEVMLEAELTLFQRPLNFNAQLPFIAW